MLSKELQAVSSWIHNEGQCVTLSRIAQSINTSRGKASSTLKEVAQDKLYRATWCQEEATNVGEVPCTVFRLVQEEWKGTADDKSRTLFALGLKSSEKVHAAHERDMSQCRDLLTCKPMALVHHEQRVIVPSSEMQTLWDESLQQQVSTTVDLTPKPDIVDPTKIRTKTTAAAFFGKSDSKGASKSTSTKTAKSTKTVSSSSSASTSKSKFEDEKENKEIGSKQSATRGIKKQPPAIVAEPSKATSKAASNKAAVGDADDFVGDMDMDSDDEEDVVMESVKVPVPPAPKPKRLREEVQTRKTLQQDDDSDKEKDDEQPDVAETNNNTKTGVINAFATEKPSTRRRKRLVENTFVDQDGYLQTETQEVWEEVPLEAPAPKAPVAARSGATKSKPKTKASNSKNNLKQGSIMGFFAKK